MTAHAAEAWSSGGPGGEGLGVGAQGGTRVSAAAEAKRVGFGAGEPAFANAEHGEDTVRTWLWKTIREIDEFPMETRPGPRAQGDEEFPDVGRLERVEVDVDVLAAVDRLVEAAGEFGAFRRNFVRGRGGVEASPVDALDEFIDVGRIAGGGAAFGVLEHMGDGRELARVIPGTLAVGDDQIDDAAGADDAIPLGEGGDGIGDVFEDVRGDEVIERMVVKREGAGVAVVVGEVGLGAERLEAVDVNGSGLETGHGGSSGADLGAELAGADPLRDFFLVGHGLEVAMASRL